MSVCHQRKAALVVETLREKKKRIRNHPSPITQDQDQEEEADNMHCKVATGRASFR